MKTIFLSIAMGFAGSACLSAQDVAPPPRPADAGPTLAATMQFIQEKISAIGVVNVIAYSHDNVAGNDWTNVMRFEITNVRADTAACHVASHLKETRDGKVINDQESGFPLKDVVEVVVETLDQALKQADTAAGLPQISPRADPPVFVVSVRRKIGENYFYLFDESMANRLAKAFVHAVEICGGGNKDPF